MAMLFFIFFYAMKFHKSLARIVHHHHCHHHRYDDGAECGFEDRSTFDDHAEYYMRKKDR